jgi:hypothetical protein
MGHPPGPQAPGVVSDMSGPFVRMPIRNRLARIKSAKFEFSCFGFLIVK